MSDNKTPEMVQVPTSQDQAKEMPYADFGYRLGAYLIDYMILQFIYGIWIFILYIFFFIIIIVWGASTNFEQDPETNPALIITMVVLFVLAVLSLFVIYWLYYALFDSGKTQGTPGKLALKLKVTDQNGERISFLRATGRHFGMYISGMILGIGYLFPLWTEKKQTLHDQMAGCVVLRKDV